MRLITPTFRARVSRIYTLCKPAFPWLRLLCQGLFMVLGWWPSC